MKRNHIAVLFFLVSLAAASCSKAPFTNGVPTSESRTVGHFRAISMHNNVNVRLKQSNHPHLELTCPKNLIENIVTELSGDTLVIRNDNRLNWLRSYDYDIDLTVYYDSLREISYASIGDLYSAQGDSICGTGKIIDDSLSDARGRQKLSITAFRLNVSEGSGDIDLNINSTMLTTKFTNGTSKITLKGNVGYAEYSTRAYGPIHAEALRTNIVRANSESTNDIYVWAMHELAVKLSSIGNIYYKGSAEPIVETCTSTGRPIRLE